MAQMFQTLERVMRAPTDRLNLQCPCGHRVAFDRTMAFQSFGADSTPPDVRRRARCAACGARGEARVWI